jgi:hypothetical protein
MFIRALMRGEKIYALVPTTKRWRFKSVDQMGELQYVIDNYEFARHIKYHNALLTNRAYCGAVT